MVKIWANSGDSHGLEPEDLFHDRMPKALADRMPRSVKDGDFETVYVDGQEFRRRMPRPSREGEYEGMRLGEAVETRAPGAMDPELRLLDLDHEGVWGEVVFPSLGLWAGMIRDPELILAGSRAINDWAYETFIKTSPRYVPAATVSLLSVDDAVKELQRAASLGFRCLFMPTAPPTSEPDFNQDHWEPLWSAAEEANMVVTFHIGTDPVEPNGSAGTTINFRGPGGAVLNYTNTTFGGQRAACKMVSSGALDRHPDLKIFIAEGGAAWVPFMGDRMNEAYRQFTGWIEPKLSMTPKEFLFRQVYSSFQHDVTAVQTVTSTGYDKVMWGSDYPHVEGTWGHSQETLHELFDDTDAKTRYRMTVGAFLELFPEVGEPPELNRETVAA